jgi:hypothetical protein
MTRQYAPKAFLRHVPFPLTRALFEKLDVPLALDGGKVPDGDVEPVFDACQRLAPADFPTPG